MGEHTGLSPRAARHREDGRRPLPGTGEDGEAHEELVERLRRYRVEADARCGSPRPEAAR
ncbi:hypothetical protein ACGRHY_05255 [Streptomyces sp. HK10]|uniref:hypothetical protein n=1 Tax=Streptomyces sp. HK10 TaxID=3373255 RepID=UPI003748EF8E